MSRCKRGRPPERTMPEPIDADPEDIMRAVVSCRPRGATSGGTCNPSSGKDLRWPNGWRPRRLSPTSEPTIQDVLDRLDGLCERVSSLEGTVNRGFAAMGAEFRMMADQLGELRSGAAPVAFDEYGPEQGRPDG